MSAIDLSQLPAPNIVEVVDFETLLAERKAALVALYPAADQASIAATLALESEPITKILQENAYREMLLRQRINEAAQAVMIAYANDGDLDALLANWNVKRLIVQPADTSATPPRAEIKEDDAAFRMRGLLAWDALSVAGPTGAYEFFALSADGQVADAKASSPSPSVAVVTILSTQGDGSADQTLIDTVFNALNDENVRPIADRLSVQSAEIIHYSITAVLHISSTGPDAEVIISSATDQLKKWINPKRRIGVEVPRSAIDAVLHVQGVRKVELIGWTDITPTPNQATYCTGFSITRATE